MTPSADVVSLPAPRLDSQVSVERVLRSRRSVREFRKAPITLTEVSQLLWAAQGVTHGDGFRTAPSAGALYPLELYLIAGEVTGLSAGVYRYEPGKNQLLKILDGDLRTPLAHAALDQSWIGNAAAVLAFAAVPERTTRKYSERGIRYIHMEIGHAAQNVLLEAVALDLGTAVVGAFVDEQVQTLLQLPKDQPVLYLIPVGKP